MVTTFFDSSDYLEAAEARWGDLFAEMTWDSWEAVRSLMEEARLADLELEALEVQRALDEAGPGSYLLARASLGGARPYETFSALVADTSPGGLFAGREIARIWDEDGALMVSGGGVSAEARVIPPELEPLLAEAFDGTARSEERERVVEAAWELCRKPHVAERSIEAQREAPLAPSSHRR